MAENGNQFPDEMNERVTAFLQLLNAVEVDIQAFLFSIVPNRSDVQDICQELRLRLWQQFEEYDPSKEFGAWARTIAIYLVMAHRKKTLRVKALPLNELLLSNLAEKFSTSQDQHSDRRAAMDLCLEELSESRRKVLMRYYSGHESLGQIAERIGTTYTALQRKLHRIRTSLFDCISQKIKKGDV